MSGGKECYPGSDVLINKYNIHDKELLEKFEIQKVLVKLLGLDTKPKRIDYTYDVDHFINIHRYLFGDIYEWAGTFRKENLYKSERVLSGGSAEYADYHEIEIISDALQNERLEAGYFMSNQQNEEKYQIAKEDYEAFRDKYSIKQD